jgi:hypothetical protein
MLQRFQNLLEPIVLDPAQRIMDFSLATIQEVEQ